MLQKQHCAAVFQLPLNSQHCGGRAGRAVETLRIVACLQKVSLTRRARHVQLNSAVICSRLNIGMLKDHVVQNIIHTPYTFCMFKQTGVLSDLTALLVVSVAAENTARTSCDCEQHKT